MLGLWTLLYHVRSLPHATIIAGIGSLTASGHGVSCKHHPVRLHEVNALWPAPFHCPLPDCWVHAACPHLLAKLEKQGPRTHTQSTLCLMTLLAVLTKSARMHKHASETRTGTVNSDSRSWLNTLTDAAAPGRAFPASRQVFQAPPWRRRHHTELDSTNTPDKEDKTRAECEATRYCVQCEQHAD